MDDNTLACEPVNTRCPSRPLVFVFRANRVVTGGIKNMMMPMLRLGGMLLIAAERPGMKPADGAGRVNALRPLSLPSEMAVGEDVGWQVAGFNTRPTINGRTPALI